MEHHKICSFPEKGCTCEEIDNMIKLVKEFDIKPSLCKLDAEVISLCKRVLEKNK